MNTIKVMLDLILYSVVTVMVVLGQEILPSKLVVFKDLNTPPSMIIQMDQVMTAIVEKMQSASNIHIYGVSESHEEVYSGINNDTQQRHRKHIAYTRPTTDGTINSEILDTLLHLHFPYSQFNRTAEIAVLLVNSGTILNGEIPQIMNLKKTIVIQFGQKENTFWTQRATRKHMAFLVSKPEDIYSVIVDLKKMLGVESGKVCDTTQYCGNMIPRSQLNELCQCLECNEICRFRLNNETWLSRECRSYCSDDPHFKAFDNISVDETISTSLTNKSSHSLIIGLIVGGLCFVVLAAIIGGCCYYCKCKKPYQPVNRQQPKDEDVENDVQGREQDPLNPPGPNDHVRVDIAEDVPNQPDEEEVNPAGQEGAEGNEGPEVVNGEDDQNRGDRVEEQRQVPDDQNRGDRVEEQRQVPDDQNRGDRVEEQRQVPDDQNRGDRVEEQRQVPDDQNRGDRVEEQALNPLIPPGQEGDEDAEDNVQRRGQVHQNPPGHEGVNVNIHINLMPAALSDQSNERNTDGDVAIANDGANNRSPGPRVQENAGTSNEENGPLLRNDKLGVQETVSQANNVDGSKEFSRLVRPFKDEEKRQELEKRS